MSLPASKGHGALLRALDRSALQAGLEHVLLDGSFKRWCSATFEGGHHFIKVKGATSEALVAWLGDLDEDAVTLPGFTVASLQASYIVSIGGRTEAHLEAITVVDG